MSEVIVTFLASYLVFVVILSLVVWWVADGWRNKELMVAAAVSGFVAWVVAAAAKDLVQIPRPYILDGVRVLTMTIPRDAAFPSEHSALLFALATVVWQRNRKWGVVYFVAAGLVGWGRVMAHVHYPGDILGGMAIGVGVGWVVSRFNLKGWVKRLEIRH